MIPDNKKPAVLQHNRQCQGEMLILTSVRNRIYYQQPNKQKYEFL
jgi:hypothetical protein